MMKFEYKTLIQLAPRALKEKTKIKQEEDRSSELNELGAVGWELVSYSPVATAYGTTVNFIAVFKRPL